MDEVRLCSSFENEIATDSDDSSLGIVETTFAEDANVVISCSSESDDEHDDIGDVANINDSMKHPMQLKKDDCNGETTFQNSSQTKVSFDTIDNQNIVEPCCSSLETVLNESTVEEKSNFIYAEKLLHSVLPTDSSLPDVKNKNSGIHNSISALHNSCEAITPNQSNNKIGNVSIENIEKANKSRNDSTPVIDLTISPKVPEISEEMRHLSSKISVNDHTNSLNTSREDNKIINDVKNTEADQLLAEIERLKFEINETENEIKNKKLTIRSVDMNNLPDKGLKLKVSISRDQRNLDNLSEQLQRVNDKFNSLFKNNKHVEDSQNKLTDRIGFLHSANLQDMGKKALETHRIQQSLTVDSLRKIHSSLSTCPSEETVESDPLHLKIPLMLHQKQALAWLLWREKETPSGGILADDMGLGKTLTMLSLVVKQNEASLKNDSESSDNESSDDSDCNRNFKRYYKGGTLIICPSSIIGQWESEINNKIKSNFINCQIFHGSSREKKARRLAKLDAVITTYTIARVEAERGENKLEIGGCLQDSPLYSVKWKRIILDEAHVIRNHRSKTATAIFKLKGKHRWALTGTPIHNKTEDFFSLIKFLRCKPFNDFEVWKKWVEAKEESGMMRMNMLTKSLMLRRTKAVLNAEGIVGSLPKKFFQNIEVQLSGNEYSLYEEVSNFSKNLLCQLLFKKAEKENISLEGITLKPGGTKKLDPGENPFSGHPALEGLFKKVANMENVQTHQILVLLLRLRQICCHPALMKSMIEREALAQDGIQDSFEENLLAKMSSLSISNAESENDDEGSTLVETSKVWDLKNPVFSPSWKSSKVSAIIDLLENNLLKTNDKIVIVSQWTSMLDILHEFIKKIENCKCDMLTGKIPVPHRMQIVNDFNHESSSLKVLLLSLTAGGVGLNLVGGNNLILTDVHWNPQLEAQACDRVYRLGQKKPVKIYKFICSGTIEERIELIQKQKLEIANNVLSSAKRVKSSHLSLKDLMMLFNIDNNRQNNNVQ